MGSVQEEKEKFSLAGGEVKGHSESIFDAKTGTWSQPKFVTDPFLRVHGLSPALNYGQQAFEGLKAFRGPDGSVHAFRASKHAARMRNSASILSMQPPPVEHFIRCVNLAVSQNKELVPPHSNENAFLYIRPILFGSSKHLGLTAPSEFTLAVYVEPIQAYHGSEPLDALIIDEFDRAAIRGTGAAKVGGNYAPVFKYSMQASSEGFGITLHLDSRTQSTIDEFSSCGFIGVYEDQGSITLVTPNSESVMPSVTVDSCIQIAESKGWKVEKRPIPYTELASFSEVLAVGTGASIVSIRSVTRKSTDEKFVFRSEKVAKTLLDFLRGIQMGKEIDEFGWREPVE
ncbi:branched-chain-amino-acid aminotransferase TOXF [Phlyctema vagabunda]|uniref:Branched-chain-amino-acid aminotransferase TOXF n=1 Tax=Phlyctema vagabunda TaxID=108571 RepID=A0ABR4PDB3_9HELO